MSEPVRPLAELSPEEKRAFLAQLLRKKANETATEYPLSYGQQALWFIWKLDPKNAAYNVHFAARIRNELDTSVLHRVFQTLVDRHVALRTTFPARDGHPVQLVHRQMAVSFTETDASTWREEDLHEFLVREAHRAFDLEQGPLMRVNLFKRSRQEHILTVTVHHIVYDVISLVIILDELRVLYPAERDGKPAPLPPQRWQYTDYVSWQRKLLAGPEGQNLQEYWQRQLAGGLPVLNLPTDRPRPLLQTFNGSSYMFRVDKGLTRQLKAIAKTEGVTSFVLFLSTIQVLLYRYSRQEDILVGSPMVSRNKAKFEGIVGYFINPVVLRASFSENPSFRAFLRQVRQTVLEALEHQDYPFSLLVEQLQLARDISRPPLFQVMFNVPKAHRLEEQGVSQFVMGDAGARMDFGGLELELFTLEQRAAMFDLLFAMVETEEGLSASWQYNTDLFDRTTIVRMAQHFQNLLTSIAANPNQDVANLPIVSENERHQMVVTWNDTADEDFPLDFCFHELFEEQVRRTPEAIAAVYSGRGLSYQELNQRTNSLAATLDEAGLKKGGVVAVLANRGLELLTTMIAIFQAGGVYLPLDPRHPAQRTSQIVARSRTSLVLATEEFVPFMSQVLAHRPEAKRPFLLPLKNPLLRDPLPEMQIKKRTPHCTPDDLAYVIYTSGSTGVPKGAMVEHKGMLNHLYAKIQDLDLTAKDIIAQTASQCFDISIWQFLAALLIGGRVHICSDDIVYDPKRLLQEVNDQEITILQTVPSLMRAMLEEIASQRPQDTLPLSALRWLVPTGEALPPDLCRRWLDKYPPIPLLNAYGPTECSDDVTHYPIFKPPAESVVNMPIGRPLAHMRLYVLDSYLQPVPIGVTGELYVGGIGVGRGYLHDAGRTAEAFIPDPFSQSTGSRLYKTGDVARYQPDGNIEFLGRVDYQVKVRGFRIELGEIETVLEQHAAVREAVVLAQTAAADDKVLVAYVVPADDTHPPETEQVRAFLKEHLPAYMIPSAFITLAAMPLTANGKIDRKRLPVWQRSRPQTDVAYVASRTSIEKTVATIWADVLQLERVGIHDNFFMLGGHSLLAIQVASRLREAFTVELPLYKFFRALTVAELAHEVEQAMQGETAEPLVLSMSELRAEAYLEPAIRPPAVPVPTAAAPAHIFLTGATGFVGAFLLHELLQQTEAKIHCLVRNKNAEEGIQRIQTNLEFYSLWSDAFGRRIVPVAGDLSQPYLGLSQTRFQNLTQQIDVIYHNGAMVNLTYPYEALKATNVLGTQEVLRLAAQNKVKPVNHVSTISVFPLVGHQLIRETTSLDHNGVLDGGYAQSKWVAEKLVTIAGSRGIPVRIFRLGRVTGHSQTGKWNANDTLFRLVKACIVLGRVPALDMMVDMTPVDYVSQAIICLSKQKELNRNVFHLVNPHLLSWQALVDQIRAFGYPLEAVPYGQWQTQVRRHIEDSPELYSLLSFFSENAFGAQPHRQVTPLHIQTPVFDCQNTLKALEKTHIVPPRPAPGLLDTYFSYFVRHGYLNTPPQR